MTELLRQVISEIEKLPAEQQDGNPLILQETVIAKISKALV